MREADLFPAVRQWLERQGWEVHVEIFGHDIVAVKDGRALVVEMKVCLSYELVRQLHNAATWADEVIGAVGTEPLCSGVSNMRLGGYGLLLVQPGGKVRQKLKPKPQPWQRVKKRKYRFDQLIGRTPAMEHEVAGLPACRQLREQRERRFAPQDNG